MIGRATRPRRAAAAAAVVVLGLLWAVPAAAQRASPRDLAQDEALGGHTLARHVGQTDVQLRERLERERQISAASTYTDRAAAERSIGDALATSSDRVKAWASRRGRRPNLVLRHHAGRGGPIGRSLARGDPVPRLCHDAVVVLRWDDRRELFYVLTSYPEARR